MGGMRIEAGKRVVLTMRAVREIRNRACSPEGSECLEVVALDRPLFVRAVALKEGDHAWR